LTLGLCDRVARREPVHREIVIRIGESRTSLAGVWRLAAVRIGVPRCIGDRLQLFFERVEGGIDEARSEAFSEFLPVELYRGHAFAYLGGRHRALLGFPTTHKPPDAFRS